MTDFNSDISEWNVKNVRSYTRAFEGATKFNRDLSKWDVTKASDFDMMFKDAHFFNFKTTVAAAFEQQNSAKHPGLGK